MKNLFLFWILLLSIWSLSHRFVLTGFWPLLRLPCLKNTSWILYRVTKSLIGRPLFSPTRRRRRRRKLSVLLRYCSKCIYRCDLSLREHWVSNSVAQFYSLKYLFLVCSKPLAGGSFLPWYNHGDCRTFLFASRAPLPLPETKCSLKVLFQMHLFRWFSP